MKQNESFNPIDLIPCIITRNMLITAVSKMIVRFLNWKLDVDQNIPTQMAETVFFILKDSFQRVNEITGAGSR